LQLPSLAKMCHYTVDWLRLGIISYLHS
jgi:hypothetical protein